MQNDKLVTNSFDFSSVSFSLEEVPCSVQPLSFDESLCIGCGTCARVCQCDILFPSDKKGTHPIVAYPGECYYCGACELFRIIQRQLPSGSLEVLCYFLPGMLQVSHQQLPDIPDLHTAVHNPHTLHQILLAYTWSAHL